MFKRMLLLIIMLSFSGCSGANLIKVCSQGGDECPKQDISITYKMKDDSIGFEVLRKGELNERAVLSEEECKELLVKYKEKRSQELSP